jgi:hypothetical protein
MRSIEEKISDEKNCIATIAEKLSFLRSEKTKIEAEIHELEVELKDSKLSLFDYQREENNNAQD